MAKPVVPEWVFSAELARRSLKEYVKQAWHVVEPSEPYIHGWHIDAVCDHLQAVSEERIHKLIINIPPRHAKSLLAGVFWPTWEWISQPHKRWMFASYKEELSIRDSLKCRRILSSPWFQQRWGEGSQWAVNNPSLLFKLVGDQNEKKRYENDKTGYRIATSIGGALGEGANRLVLDDPHSVEGVESDTVRRTTVDWVGKTWSTRLNNPKKDAQVIIMQRLHEEDVCGHMLKEGDWEHLMIPAEYDQSDLLEAV